VDENQMATLNTRLGNITGSEKGDIQVFRGIRYAQAPVGDLRFMAPRQTGPWQGTLDATKFGNRSIQGESAPIFGPAKPDEPDEDCLFLNIYTPGTGGEPRPVLFWIHGGAYVQGSGNDYDGSVLAAQGDVVVVTINYRLGVLGFLDLASLGDEYQGSASNGFRDQICALQWVHDNIADYGGDAGNVTLFGESAGAGSVNALLAAPSADGLYHRAISHSGNSVSVAPRDITDQLAANLAIEKSELLSHLRTLDSKALLEMQTAVGTSGTGVDGTVITRSTYQAIAERGSDGVPYIAGSNHDEGTLFTAIAPDESGYAAGAAGLAIAAMDGQDTQPYLDGLKALYGDDPKTIYEQVWVDLFRRPSTLMCIEATQAGPGGWLYRFDMPTTIMDGKLGATHACEIPFTFNTYADPSIAGIAFHDGTDPDVQALALAWSNTVIAFARSGNPNGAGLPHWPSYAGDDRSCMILDTQVRVEQDVDAVHSQFWAPPIWPAS
jgi:para-nitrobenzyl esterase